MDNTDHSFHNSLDILENETNQLLKSIQPTKKKTRQQLQEDLLSKSASFSSTLGGKTRTIKKNKRLHKDVSKRSLLQDADKTLDLFNLKINNNKITVEVLDVDSPDNSPRQKLTKKQLAMMEEYEGQLQDQRKIRTAELKFRNQDFKAEHIRILSRADIFVPGPGVTIEDIANEKSRLAQIEISARAMKKYKDDEISHQIKFLEQHKAALSLQSLFRGYLGRKKFMLVLRLRDLGESDSDWIEVRDKQNGDTWFYNKSSGISQWERPENMEDCISLKSNVKKLPHLPDGLVGDSKSRQHSPLKTSREGLPKVEKSAKKGGLSAVKYAADNVMSTLQHEAEKAMMREAEALREVDGILGLKYLHPDENLLTPDGTFKRPQLRETIKDALTESRFDSVSSLLADVNWIDEGGSLGRNNLPRASTMPSMRRVDRSRKQFVSVILPKKKRTNTTTEARLLVDRTSLSADGTRDLTMREVDHPGFATSDEGFNNTASTMCFGCWSSGNRKNCKLHDEGEKKQASETMLLCKNWDLAVLRRRYRSEEIQEIFLQRAASLKYDIKRKKFLTVVEQRHPVYRVLNQLVIKCNQKSTLWMKAVHWANSLKDLVHSGHINTPKAIELGEKFRQKKSETNFHLVRAYARRAFSGMPLAPITGYSWPERTCEELILVKHFDCTSEQEVDLIQVFPTPVAIKLYQAREYPLTIPRTIPMPRAEIAASRADRADPVRNIFMKESDNAAWLEVMSKSLAHDAITFASSQIKAVTPIAGIEALRRIKEPPVTSIKFATLGRKPRPGMRDVGGLPAELLVSQIITTFIPPQYGHLVVLEKSSFSSGHSPEISITFASLPLDPIPQIYVLRPVDHILNQRKAPTITVTTQLNIDERFYYGNNRPEQTGEHDLKGFRTTEVAAALPVPIETDARAFTPAADIASLNDPKANRAVTTKVDGLYPFCEPSTRDNSTLDFYHLLLDSSFSPSKPQVFTAISVQEAGQFLNDMRVDLPMGQLLVSVYRSWAFTQRDIYEEFKSDDGISYWYHRKTGQTFWERPLFEEEKGSPLTGAAKIDPVHEEEPTVAHAAQDGAVRRVSQGQFRKQIVAKHESVEEATKRRRLAAASISNAKSSGVIPPLAFSDMKASAGEHQQQAIVSRVEPQPMTTSQHSPAHKSVTFQSPPPPANLESSEAIGASATKTVGQAPLKPSPVKSSTHSDVNNEMVATITQSIEKFMSLNMFDKASPQDMVKLGLGMGMAILQNQAIGANNTANQVEESKSPEKQPMSYFPSIVEGEQLPEKAVQQGKFSIGVSESTRRRPLNNMLDHTEEAEASQSLRDSEQRRLTSLEAAQEVELHRSAHFTAGREPAEDLLPVNADEQVKANVPVLVYPEVSTTIPGGPPGEISLHPMAGVNAAFSKMGDYSSRFVQGGQVRLRRTAQPLPNGFYEAIVSKHIAKQSASYLPQVPNLPQTRIVGRVKPRSAAGDWLALSFDPWSAGKPPLTSLFIPNLATQAGKLFEGGEEHAKKAIELIRDEVTKDAFMSVEDKEGQEQIRAVTSKAAVLSADFRKLCSMARHGKFEEVENLMNQSDWEVPINYTDEQGRTLLHIAAQNGYKRLVKLCLRRGININGQTLSGQTALHYAYGFGFAELGEYLISKGADDAVRNNEGLTCYEGLESKHVSYL